MTNIIKYGAIALFAGCFFGCGDCPKVDPCPVTPKCPDVIAPVNNECKCSCVICDPLKYPCPCKANCELCTCVCREEKK